jgi:integrase
MKLTPATVRSLALPEGAEDKIFFDSDLPGFGLRIRASGVKTWIVQYAVARRTRRIVLGSPAILDLNKAREAAKDILAAVRLGKDPAAERAENKVKARETFGDCLQLYLSRRRNDPKLRARSYREIERHLVKNLKALHTLSIAKIDRRAIALQLARFTDEHGAIQANRTATSVHTFFQWCIGEGLIDANPATVLNKNREVARDRALSVAELVKVLRALPAGDFADIIKLLVLTGQRESEIGDLRWSEINLDRRTITLPATRTKNRREHIFPLSAEAAAILEARPRPEGRDFVFGTGRGHGGFDGWGWAKGRLDAVLQLDQPWVIHDLRRSFSTGLGNLGIPPHTIEALLNHQSGTKAGVSGRYNRSAYEREARQAVDLWGATLLAAVDGRGATVVPIRAAE